MKNITDIINLQKITLADENWFNRLSKMCVISDLSFPLLYAYRNLLNVRVKQLNTDTALVVQNDAKGKPCYTIIGQINKDIINDLLEGGLTEFSYISHNQLEIFLAMDHLKWDISYNPDFSDYIYDFDKYLTPPKKIRQDINHYRRLDLERKLVEMNQKNFASSLKIFEEWGKNHDLEDSIFGNEFEAYQELGDLIGRSSNLTGFLLYEEDNPVAFLVMEKRQKMMVAQFGKSSNNRRGITSFLHQECFKQFQGQFKWLNLEEDMGLSGLRLFKQKLRPTFMVNKYTVKLR